MPAAAGPSPRPSVPWQGAQRVSYTTWPRTTSAAGAARRSSVPPPPQPATITSASVGALPDRLRHIVAVVFDQIRESCARVERGELLEATDRLAIDEDLRNGTAAGTPNEVGAQRRVVGHIDLVVDDAARVEQPLGADAEGTARRGVDLDVRHAVKLDGGARRRKRRVDSPGGRRYGP